ncbi:MAG: hypothetical protein KDN22_26845 [Verrucomicrobiae bacterium]|nr:hypothetical protein [Verrucomicrobiae bacterium]
MTKGNASKERDEARERLMAMAAAPTAPGQNQAAKALQQQEEKPKVATTTKVSTPQVESKAAAVVAEKKPKTKKRSVVHEKAEKISVSLHPQDQERAEKVEDALRKAGLIPRRAPTSFLLKVALAAFDEKNVEKLKEIVEEVRAQDGRGKWMHELKG